MGLGPCYGLWPMSIRAKPEPGAQPVIIRWPPARQSLAAHPAAEPLQKDFCLQGRELCRFSVLVWRRLHQRQVSMNRSNLNRTF